MRPVVTEAVIDGVLILTIDNPPVNASSRAVRSGLVAGIDRLSKDDMLQAAVIVGANDSFVAGSDISEFAGDVPEPLLPQVIRTIENSAKPVVAAVDGYALGGGLELALGCDARVVTPDALLGLPEVGLGMIPGAGGTQRLPRLVGRAEALRIILSGRKLSGTEAADVGLADRIASDDLLETAIRFASSASKCLVAEIPVPVEHIDLESVAATTVSGARRPNVDAAVQLVSECGTIDVREGLRREREQFNLLRASPDAAALRHIFFAERASARRAGIKPNSGAVNAVGIIGSGAMGAGIAAAFARVGVAVQMMDAEPDQVDLGLRRVRESLGKAVRRGQLSAADSESFSAHTWGSTDIGSLSSADLIIEAVVERADVKTEVLNRAAEVAPRATLATNTSYLSVSDLARRMGDSSRLVGMHFFNPADAMKLLEIVPTTHVADDALAVALGAAKQVNKTTVIAGDSEGFIGNRIFAVYRRHAEYLLEDGSTPAEVDAAMEDFGFAMGPFAVADLSGLQIAKSLRDRHREMGRVPARYVDIPDLLCERGWLGRRSGRGYYRYGDGQRIVDAEVTRLIEAESQRKGIVRRAIAAEEIVDRLVGAIVVEGARAVADGTARHADDVDVVLINGYGFPRFRGGPMWWARLLTTSARRELALTVAEAAAEKPDPELLEGGIGHE